ncbi:hypothetical protein V5R04_15105 [Jonesiaceae bacterium BS-20]|uniref:IPT/TIG domain-containing protein n=1 Tax=Jonesiaceae bacterium BS-20 TaxID=3120821 RepID=A0AAU7DTL8_9MICO
MSSFAIASLAIGTSLLGASAAQAADINIPDPVLLEAINKAIDPTRAANTPVTQDEADGVNDLQLAQNVMISDLTGLEAFGNLTQVGLNGTFSDLAPLSGQENLVSLFATSPNVEAFPARDFPSLVNVLLQDTKISDLQNVADSSVDSMLALVFPNAPVASLQPLSGKELISILQFGGWTTGSGGWTTGDPNDYTMVTQGIERSPISDLSPLETQKNALLVFTNSSISDLSPLAANDTLGVILGDMNFISDLSVLPDNVQYWNFADQEVDLGSAAVGASIANPLRDIEGGVVTINPANAPEGFVDNGDGTWSFTNVGEKVIPFHWQGEEGEVTDLNYDFDSVFSGTVTVNVTEGAITAGDVAIDGVAGIGQELTAQTSGWEPADVELGYQWFVDGEPVAGATDSTFVPSGEHAGKDVTVEVTATKPGYTPESVESDPVTVAVPSVVVGPDTVKPGENVIVEGEGFAPGEEVEITVTPGGPTVTVEADEDGNITATVPVPEDAADGDYTVGAEGKDSGVTAEDDFTVAGESVTAGVITAGKVSIEGVAGIGKELTAQTSGWEPADVELGYQWFVDGEPVAGATGETFVPSGEHAGKNVTVVVTATKPGYGSQTATSDPVKVATPAITVAPSPAKPGDDLTIKGENFAPGEEVTVTVGPDGATVTVKADENGSFTATVKVPNDAKAGDYTVTAKGAKSGFVAESDFSVAALVVDKTDDEQTVTDGKKPADDSTNLAQTGLAETAPIYLIAAVLLALLGAGLLTARTVARQRN